MANVHLSGWVLTVSICSGLSVLAREIVLQLEPEDWSRGPLSGDVPE